MHDLAIPGLNRSTFPERMLDRGVKKQYRLGSISGRTLQADLQSWWAKKRGQEDPNLRVDTDASRIGERFWALNGIDLSVRRGERDRDFGLGCGPDDARDRERDVALLSFRTGGVIPRYPFFCSNLDNKRGSKTNNALFKHPPFLSIKATLSLTPLIEPPDSSKCIHTLSFGKYFFQVSIS